MLSTKIKMNRILQINTNRSKGAQDLALQTAVQLNIDILTITEPNISSLGEQWIADETKVAAIKWMKQGLQIKRGKEKGFTWATHKNLTVYSCYISPNVNLQEYLDFLDRLEGSIRTHDPSREIVITGDFNASSSIWGSRTTNRRGLAVEEWIGKLNLIVANTGTRPTFERREQSSFLDLTISNHKLTNRIINWAVLTDLESLSDHKYIVFEILEKETHTNRPKNTLKNTEQNSFRKQIDKTMLVKELEKSLEGKPVDVKVLNTALKKACKKSELETIHRKDGIYWYNETIAVARKECIKTRRAYLRAKPESRESTHKIYMEARYKLNREIANSKREHWKSLCDDIERNPWGTGYKIIANKFKIPQPKLEERVIENTLKTLFPTHDLYRHQIIETNSDKHDTIEVTRDEILEVANKIATNKAPGPDQVPALAIKTLLKNFPEEISKVFTNLLQKGTFPVSWKQAKVVLLLKPGKPENIPSSYRPICLLNTIGKAFEVLINNRLQTFLEENSILSDKQYGFRKNRSTITAINRIVDRAKLVNKTSLKSRKFYLLVLLDIKNAFNSVSWRAIKQSLDFYKVPTYIQKIIDNYLTDRTITSSKTKIEMTAGVPQGSILGPTLWNVTYNEVFNLGLPEGADLTGYADDLALTIEAKTEALLELRANAALRIINNWLKKQSLELAAQKSEAILITNKYKVEKFKIEVEGEQIGLKDAVKYLGVTIDKRLSFSKHIREATEKAAKISNNLNRIMPRTFGAGEGKRRLLAKIAEQIISYGSPVWDENLEIKQNTKHLEKAQRITAIRVSRAYKTVSSEALMVIGRCIPWEIKLKLRRNIRNRTEQCEDFENKCMEKWQQKWRASSTNKGKWTKSIIKDINSWYNRPHGELTYEMTQALTGHGCFQSYLYKIKKKLSPTCVHCDAGEDDDVEHTLFHCSKFRDKRTELTSFLNSDLNKDTFIENLLKNSESWDKINAFIVQVITEKEKYDRAWQRGETTTEMRERTGEPERLTRSNTNDEPTSLGATDRMGEVPQEATERHLEANEEERMNVS